MEATRELITGPKEPKPAKAPPTRDAAADAARRQKDQEDKQRALLARGATGTLFAGGTGLAINDNSAPKRLTGQ